MRGLMTAMTVASLLMGPATAMAQATGTYQANPYQRQGAAPTAAAPQSMPPQPVMRLPRSPGGQTDANQFQSEAAAKQTCAADTVVWVNTGGSKAWHVSGDKYYGHTKRGAFMCEQTAQQAGYHGSGGPARAQRAATQAH